MTVDKPAGRVFGLLFLVVILSACTTSPTADAPLVIVPEQQAPEVTEEPAPEPEQEPVVTPKRPTTPPEPDRPCAWSQIRGVATLTGMVLKQGIVEGTWQFFPGDEVVFHPVPDNANKGDEYKALLRRPLSGDCEHPRLIIVSPV